MTSTAIHPVIVGTAGHVDHGKSSLVRRLTGIDPDRWQEEKERGLTIDLGFAPLVMPDGRLVGMIDVPGHERFVKNMVAGATSIDLVLLVIAADDAVMPQTREHLDVVELLGVRHGIVALTKVDLVDEETRLLAEEDIRDLLRGRCIEDAPIIPVSSVTGEGIDVLERTLVELTSTLEPRSTEGVFRMPVQRVFSIAGFGTVLTGIPLAGEVAIGDSVEIVGKGLRSRIRGIHAYGRPVESARAGHSTALNLPDVPLASVHRGDVVAAPDTLAPVDRLEVEVHAVTSTTPIRHGETVHLHVGTMELGARLFLLDQKDLAPGTSGLAQVVCDAPIVCLPGDFVLVRRQSPSRTIGGGRVIGTRGRRLRRFRDDVIGKLRAKEEALDHPDDQLALTIGEVGEAGIDRADCIRRLGWTPGEVTETLASLLDKKRVFEDARSSRLFGRASVDREQHRIERVLAEHYRAHPMSSTCPVSALRREGGEALLAVALGVLEKRGKLSLLPGGLVQDPTRSQEVTPEARARLDKLLDWLEAAGTRAHTRAEVADEFGRPGTEMLERLLEERAAVAVGPQFVWGGRAYQHAIGCVAEICGAPGGVLDIPALRDRLDTSRKYLIPFLEHLDRTGVTARKGDRRILRRT